MDKLYYIVSTNLFTDVKTISETEITNGSNLTKYFVDCNNFLWEVNTICIGKLFNTRKEADRYRLFLIEEKIKKESAIIQLKNKHLSELKTLSLKIAINNIKR